MIVGNITQLRIHGVYDRGNPNRERIALRVFEPVNMGQFGILLGIRQQDGTAYPLQDNFFWFGDGFVAEGDWLFVFTGPGKPTKEALPGLAGKHIYSVHWGRSKTILSSAQILPVLFRVDAVDIFSEQIALPDASGQTT